MPISAAVAVASVVVDAVSTVGAAVGGAIGLGAADVGAGLAAADIGAGVAAADVGAGIAAEGALTLPEILVTPGAEALGAEGAVFGTEAAAAGGGALIGGEALGAGAGAALAGGAALGADVIGSDFAALEAAGANVAPGGQPAILGGTDVAQTAPGVTTATMTPGAPGAPPAGTAGGASPQDVLQGTTGPLTALGQTGPSNLDALWQNAGGLTQADVGPITDTIQPISTTTEPQFSAMSFAPQVGATGGGGENPLATFTEADNAFANAPTGVVGQADFGTALQAGGELGAGTDPSLAALPASLNVPPDITQEGLLGASTTPAGTPTIPASTTVAGGSTGTAGTAGTTGAATPGFTLANAPGVAGGSVAPSEVTLDTGAGGGVSSGLSGLLSGSNLKTAALLAPVAGLGLTLARGQPSLPPAEQQAVQNATAEQQFGTQQLAMAQANQITPAQAQQIATWKQQQINALYQMYARMGRGDPYSDSDFLQGVQNINAQAITMQQQFIDAMITNGLNATGQANQTLTQAANLQVANDNAFQQALASSVSSFGLVAALSSRA